MDADIFKTNPQFAGLVSRLNDKLSSDKASPKVQKDFEVVRHNMRQARSEFLTNWIFYAELYEVLTDLDVADQEKSLSSDEEKLRDAFTKTLAFAELPGYLPFCTNPSSTSSLFGLTEQDINNHNPVKMHLPALLPVVVPLVEAKLRQKCEDLYAFYNPLDDKTDSTQLATAKGHSLPSIVEDRKQKVEIERSKVKESKHTMKNIFWKYYEKLIECVSLIETLIIDIKCGNQTRSDDVTVQKLLADARVLSLKNRLEQLRLGCDTYTVGSIKALKVIKGHLDNATSQAKRERSVTAQSLDAYRRLGPEFVSLASEVIQLKYELKNKEWGLSQFGKDKTSSRVSTSSSQSAAAAAGIPTSEAENIKISHNSTSETSNTGVLTEDEKFRRLYTTPS